MNKNFWIPTDAGCLTDGDLDYNTSSRVEPKRPHQWFMDPSEPELSRNKKQAIDAVNSRLVSAFPNMSYPMLGNQSNFQAVPPQYADRLFSSNLVDRNISMVATGGLNMGRKDFEDPYVSNLSAGLSMSPRVEDPSLCLNYGGVRKVKVNQVTDSEKSMQSYDYRNVGNGISLGQVFNGGEGASLTMGAGFNKMDGNFISMGHSYNKGDGNFMLMGQPFDKGNGGFISMGMHQPYEKGNSDILSVGPACNIVSSDININNGNFISIGPSYDIGSENIVSSDSSEKTGKSVVSTVTDYDKGSSSVLSMGQNYNNGDGSSISFGGVQDESETNHSGDMVNGYSLPESQPSAQNSEARAEENSTEQVTVPVKNTAPARIPKTNAAPKIKGPKPAKKLPANNFPTHVKSLLSTGILDDVPVKYVSWSREKHLAGYIRGTAYHCACLEDCGYQKALNAYEFERHAGCKTKHPNNHIHFENGKTIYAVVQELKSTPQDQLFEAIENATGSAIHEQNFRIWKESYLAASRELQRIYGKDAVAAPFS